jgi:DNA sulfur modification protein DndD
LLPFALCSELCVELEKHLDQEAATSGARSAAAFADNWVRELRDDLLSDPRLRVLLPEQQGQIELAALIDDTAQHRLAELNTSDDKPPLHDLADRERLALASWIGEIVSALPQRARVLRDELDQSERLRDSLLSELDRVPDDAGLAEVQATLRVLRTQLLETNSESSSLRDQLERTEREHLAAIAQIRKLEEQLADSLSAKSRAALLSQIGVALKDFEDELLRHRSEQFAEALVDGFNRLSRKQSLLAYATFDSESRTFRLQDPSGRELDTSSLSTGERQLFAMAILEGLRSTTGHSYPLVIDSPLAYLDENHRRSLMTQAVFESANQVVLFATDQEISLSGSEEPTSDFTCVYQLEFDALEQSSELALLTSGDPCQQA